MSGLSSTLQPRLSMLDAAAIDYVHEQSLRLLAEVGVRVPLARAQTLLRDAGALVDEETEIVRFPHDLVESAIARAPRTVLLAARDPQKDALLDHTRSYATHDGMGAMCLDHRTGERRPSTARDLLEAMIVADALDEIGVLWYTAYPCDEEPAPAIAARPTGDARRQRQARPGRGHRPGRRALRHGDPRRGEPRRGLAAGAAHLLDRLLPGEPAAARRRQPRGRHAARRAGRADHRLQPGLGRRDLAAHAGRHHGADQRRGLAAFAILQLAVPGCPLIYVANAASWTCAPRPTPRPAPSRRCSTSRSPRWAATTAFPVLSCGLSTDAKELCVQVGSDGGPMAYCTMLAGADLLTGAGMLDSAQLLYLPKLVLDAELVRQGQRLMAGLALDDEHVMLDVMARVGPGGHFLGARETRRFLRGGELQLPQLFVRGSYDGWLAEGKSESRRAIEKVDEILATHHPLPLPDGAAQHIEDIIAPPRADARGVAVR